MRSVNSSREGAIPCGQDHKSHRQKFTGTGGGAHILPEGHKQSTEKDNGDGDGDWEGDGEGEGEGS